MRITGGQFRGRPLFTLKGGEVRPTLDKTRQAFFNIIGDKIIGSRFLDLFGGTGAMGLEAVSRGAEHAVIMEKEHTALVIKNVERLGLAGDPCVRVVHADAFAMMEKYARDGETFDLIYADPPWKMDAWKRIASLGAAILSEKGVLTMEAYYKAPPPAAHGLELYDQRRYGDTALYFYTQAGD